MSFCNIPEIASHIEDLATIIEHLVIEQDEYCCEMLWTQYIIHSNWLNNGFVYDNSPNFLEKGLFYIIKAHMIPMREVYVESIPNPVSNENSCAYHRYRLVRQSPYNMRKLFHIIYCLRSALAWFSEYQQKSTQKNIEENTLSIESIWLPWLKAQSIFAERWNCFYFAYVIQQFCKYAMDWPLEKQEQHFPNFFSSSNPNKNSEQPAIKNTIPTIQLLEIGKIYFVDVIDNHPSVAILCESRQHKLAQIQNGYIGYIGVKHNKAFQTERYHVGRQIRCRVYKAFNDLLARYVHSKTLHTELHWQKDLAAALTPQTFKYNAERSRSKRGIFKRNISKRSMSKQSIPTYANFQVGKTYTVYITENFPTGGMICEQKIDEIFVLHNPSYQTEHYRNGDKLSCRIISYNQQQRKYIAEYIPNEEPDCIEQLTQEMLNLSQQIAESCPHIYIPRPTSLPIRLNINAPWIGCAVQACVTADIAEQINPTEQTDPNKRLWLEKEGHSICVELPKVYPAYTKGTNITVCIKKYDPWEKHYLGTLQQSSQ